MTKEGPRPSLVSSASATMLSERSCADSPAATCTTLRYEATVGTFRAVSVCICLFCRPGVVSPDETRFAFNYLLVGGCFSRSSLSHAGRYKRAIFCVYLVLCTVRCVAVWCGAELPSLVLSYLLP